MEKGILWAVGDEVKKLHDALNPQPFTYGEARLPNYEKLPWPATAAEPAFTGRVGETDSGTGRFYAGGIRP